jgi:hypothetical protein
MIKIFKFYISEKNCQEVRFPYMIIFVAKRGTSEHSRALAARLGSGHTHILLNSPSATGMVGYAAMVLWYPIKLVAILPFDEGPSM